ncbi:hypothetical protein MMC13_004676 [Lambiella insularis]|nr:hypothetical protein [Lambiella insularis]
MFYCAAPGLAMWLLDWGMRLYELRKRLDGKVVSLGSGWYSLILQLPRHRLDGCACTSPLAHFYIHHAESSIRELHPFTTITHLASQNLTTPQTETDIPIQFLFRKRGTFVSTHPPAKNHAWITALNPFQPHHNPTLQWTDKLASLADTQLSASNVEKSAFQPSQTTLSSQSALIEPHPMADIGLRLEGPYFTPADPSRYHTVICFVAGTGVSGAIAIANAFTALKNQQAGPPSPCAEARSPQSVSPPSKLPTSSTWQRCVIFWSVRADDYVELPFLKDSTSALEFHVHRTGHGRPRLDIDASLTAVCGLEAAAASTWVYLSGPNAFIADGERACKARKGVEWYGARWDI